MCRSSTRQQPIRDRSFAPVDSARAIGADEPAVTAVVGEPYGNVVWPDQLLDRLGRNERVIPGGQDQSRHTDVGHELRRR